MTKSKKFFFVMLGVVLLAVAGTVGVFYIYNQLKKDKNDQAS